MTRRNTRSTPAHPEIEPKSLAATPSKGGMKAKAKTTCRPVPEPNPIPSAIPSKLPSGKLATLLDRVGQLEGGTIDELADLTGWQPHTIRAAFSRLRKRGFPIALVTDAGGRKAYQLDAKED